MSAPVIPFQRPSSKRHFKVLSFEEVQGQPEPTWLVNTVLPSNGLAMLYGPPGAGKTFLALDLALAVASRQPWLGHETTSGDVLYVLAEGVAGFPKRLKAGASARGLDTTTTGRVHFIDEPVLLHSAEEVDGLLAALAEQVGRPVALIIFDTLSRCFAGCEENSAKEISRLVENADRIRRQSGATVLLIHHTNKEGDSERGSSALRGSVDAMLVVTAKNGGNILKCDKQKDAAPFNPVRFQLVETWGSCVAVPVS